MVVVVVVLSGFFVVLLGLLVVVVGFFLFIGESSFFSMSLENRPFSLFLLNPVSFGINLSFSSITILYNRIEINHQQMAL